MNRTTRGEAIRHHEQIKFTIYRTYGLGTFHNHLSGRQQTVDRQEVVDLVKLPHVRPLMQKYIESLEVKLREATSILEDADSQTPSRPKN